MGPREHGFAFSRHEMPEFCVKVPQEKRRAQGTPGALAAPIAPCGNEESHTRFWSLQVKPHHRRSLRNGFGGLLRALPGVHDLLVTVALRSSSRDLAPAQGCQNHTPLPSAKQRSSARTNALALSCDHRIRTRRFVTIAIRPSHPGGIGRDNHTVLKNGRKISFQKAEILLDVAGKSIACGSHPPRQCRAAPSG